MFQYFISTMPDASWQTLAGVLYSLREHAALKKVKRYFQVHQGSYEWVSGVYSQLATKSMYPHHALHLLCRCALTMCLQVHSLCEFDRVGN